MSSHLQLADTGWPRTGRDCRNSGLAPFAGPARHEVARRLPSPHEGVVLSAVGGGYVVARVRSEQGEALVTLLDGEGRALWTCSPGESCSSPLCLADGGVIATSGLQLVHYDSAGHPTVHEFEIPLDDSGVSINLTPQGEVVLGSHTGEVLVGTPGNWREIGSFGYDVLSPAVYSDSTLGLAGYAQMGATRVRPDGRVLWSHPEQDGTDCLVSLNRHDEMLVGNVNDQLTHAYAPDGRSLFAIPDPGVAAEHPLGWALLSSGNLRLVDRSGKLLWQRDVPIRRDWGLCQPVVDARGVIYVAHNLGVSGFDADGRECWSFLSDVRPFNVALVESGRLAFALPGELVIVH